MLKNVIGDLDRGKMSAKNQRLFDIKIRPKPIAKADISRPLSLKLNDATASTLRTPNDFPDNSIVNHGSNPAEETPMSITDR